MASGDLLRQAIATARAGHELTAREMFLQIVQAEPRNELAWMWLIGLLDGLEERIHACQQVLAINPGNANVRAYLSQLLAEQQKLLGAERLRAEQHLQQVRELVGANKRDEALTFLRRLIREGVDGAEAWRLLADLAPEVDERARALQKLVKLKPEDTHARQELQRLRHFQKNPLDLAAMYEEQGEIEKAIDAYSRAALQPQTRRQWTNIYWKITRLENLRLEKITHISPVISIARLTAGPPLLYLLLMLIQVGINPLAHSEPFLWLGFCIVLLGAFMVALASVRSRHRVWLILFKDIGAGGTPLARRTMAAAGWILVIMPHLMLFANAYFRLQDYFFSLLPR
jgi:tetratricopeptide (TPR) repeat protein